MNIEAHDEKGKKVWLDQTEVEQLLDQAADSQREIAFGLAVRSGLRSKEILDVEPQHITETEVVVDGTQETITMLRVPHGKGDKYRETPVNETLAASIKTVGDYRGASDVPVVEVTTTAALRKWIKQTRNELVVKTGDDGWKNVSMHDLRRTWASTLGDRNVDSRMIMQWGGWEKLDTFLEHYDGAYSPTAQARERQKVPWL